MSENVFGGNEFSDSLRYINTPSKFARDNLLYVQEIGRLTSIKPHICMREQLESYLFFVVTSGNGTLRVKDREYQLNIGDCVFVDCMEHYEHISSETDPWSLVWVHFYGGCSQGYYEYIHEKIGVNVIHSENYKELERYISKLQSVVADGKLSLMRKECICGEMLLHLLNTIIERADIERECSQDVLKKVVRDIRKYINGNYKSQNIMSEIRNNFDYELVKEYFTSSFGIKIEDYIVDRRYNAAKEMLRFSILSIDEIAVESGIGDKDSMIRYFQEFDNSTPEEYRSKWAAWIRK